MDCDAISHSGSIKCNHDGQLSNNSSEMVTKEMSMKPWEHELREAVAARSVETVLEILSEPGRSFSQKVLDDCLLDACGLYKERNQHLARELLRAGASIKAVSEDGWTPILISVKNGDFYLLCFFLQRGSDVNAVTSEGDSALTLSICPNRSLDIINHLLQQSGIDINHKNHQGYTALMKAVEAREIEAMHLLIDGHKRNNSKTFAISQESLDSDETVVNWCGQELFDVAARTGMVKVIKLLLSVKEREFPLIELALREDVDINYRNKEGYTALMLAAQKLSGESIIDALLLKGAEVNIKDNNMGNTALLLALEQRFTGNAKLLIEYEGGQKVDLDAQNTLGNTALLLAIKYGDQAMTNLLIDRGANVNVEDYYGDTALTLSAWHRNLRKLNKFIAHGADINHQNKEGYSALMIAARNHDEDCIKALLNSGADVNVVSHGQEKKTAISLLFETKSSYNKSRVYLLMDSLLDKGASSSYLKPDVLIDPILSDQLSCISKLVSSGFGPAELSSKKYLNEPEERVAFPVVSPFMFALLYSRPGIARYFDGIWFLSISDIQLQAKHDLFQEVLVQRSNDECSDILEEFGSQPMSLLKLSFVAVSSAIGCVPGREETVKKLPLPPFIKDKLLFKKQEVQFGYP